MLTQLFFQMGLGFNDVLRISLGSALAGGMVLLEKCMCVISSSYITAASIANLASQRKRVHAAIMSKPWK